MKLLFCKKCQDVFKLHEEGRRCLCGAVGGKLLPDGLNVEYWGEEAIPVGLANSTFAEAVRERPKEGQGRTFVAFVIPKVCPTAKKVRRPRK